MRLSYFALSASLLLVSACISEPTKPMVDADTQSTTVSSASSLSSKATMTIYAGSKSSEHASVASSKSISSAPERSAKTTDAEWKVLLTAKQYNVLREKGTETPFTSDLLHEKRKGTYVTADCGDPVFRSEQKFDSGTGWPSFWAPISPDAVKEETDTELGMTRTEIVSKCGGHLGHVFTDGPEPTGLRYCMNGIALRFIPDKEQ